MTACIRNRSVLRKSPRRMQFRQTGKELRRGSVFCILRRKSGPPHGPGDKNDRPRQTVLRRDRAGYDGTELLPRRPVAAGPVADPPARKGVAPHRAASGPARRARRRPSRQLRAAGRPAHADPASARPFRPRRAMGRIPPRLSGAGARSLRRVRHPRDVAPERHSRLAGHLSCRRKTRLHLSVQPGRVRARLPDQRHRRRRDAAVALRRQGVCRTNTSTA